jgi:hypothetical protein
MKVGRKAMDGERNPKQGLQYSSQTGTVVPGKGKFKKRRRREDV